MIRYVVQFVVYFPEKWKKIMKNYGFLQGFII